MKAHSSSISAQETSNPPSFPSSDEYLKFLQDQKQSTQGTVGADTSGVYFGSDEKMARIQDLIEQIRETTVPVLITGESGSGKEVIARTIHRTSCRESGPFVAVNCAALPSNLLESELFGHEKGSFTGATQRHIGKFEQATNGTLLLDEVTEMDLALQAKLLRALQEKEIERVGGNGPIPIKTRIIATTNRDLASAVAQGMFRQDLYYRLHVIHIDVPPLRDRPNDIDALSDLFLKKYCEQFGKPPMLLSSEARSIIKSHNFPGNIRELQNVMQRAVLLASGNEIKAQDLPIERDFTPTGEQWIQHLPIGRQLRVLETHFILETLRFHQGNRTHAAKTLGISLRTLRNKINEFTAEGIDVMPPSSGRAS
jgi:two-component system response regulator FlrC